jgi:hypothetical protein
MIGRKTRYTPATSMGVPQRVGTLMLESLLGGVARFQS